MLNSELKDEYANLVCERCKYSNTLNTVGAKCYMCKRNVTDHRVDYFEPDYAKIYKSEITGVQIIDIVTACPCLACTDYERRCCTVRCDEYDSWIRKLIN